MRLILKNPELMTNRELHTDFERVGVKNLNDKRRLVSEMAKRLNMLDRVSANPTEEMIQEIEHQFKHWKLNGAGDERK